eukprot:358630-Chlamydomonas_euryale.AAC.1
MRECAGSRRAGERARARRRARKGEVRVARVGYVSWWVPWVGSGTCPLPMQASGTVLAVLRFCNNPQSAILVGPVFLACPSFLACPASLPSPGVSSPVGGERFVRHAFIPRTMPTPPA